MGHIFLSRGFGYQAYGGYHRKQNQSGSSGNAAPTPIRYDAEEIRIQIRDRDTVLVH